MHIPKIDVNFIQTPISAVKGAVGRVYAGLKLQMEQMERDEDFYVSDSDSKVQRNILTDELRETDSKPVQFHLEEAIKNNPGVISSFGKSGLPLAYGREDFIINLENILSHLKDEKRDEILQKLGIEFSYPSYGFYGKRKAAGYDGILCLKKLDLKNSAERRVYKECCKFLYKNRVETGNEELDCALNDIIKAAPEFINIIGKKQHKSHNYSVDVHSLCVLENALNHPQYKTLTNEDKFVLKMTALFHDIGKKEGVRDPEHPFRSHRLALEFMDEFDMAPDTKKRVLLNIKNHQWLQWYNLSHFSKDVINGLTDDYMVPNDYKLALIISAADLEATSEYINNCYSNLLDDEPQRPMREAVLKKFGTKI